MSDSRSFELKETLLDTAIENSGSTGRSIPPSNPTWNQVSIAKSSRQSANPWVQNLIDSVKNALLHAKYNIQHIPNAQYIIGWTLVTGLAFDVMMMTFFEKRLHGLLDNEDCHPYGMSTDTACTDYYNSPQEAETYTDQRALYFAIDYLFRHLLRPDKAPFTLSVMLQYLPPVAYLAYHHWQVRWERNNATPPAERYEKKAAAWFSCNNSHQQQTNAITDTEAETQRIDDQNRRKPSDTALYTMPLLFTLIALWEILGSVIAVNSTEGYLNEYDKNKEVYEDLPNVSDEEKKFNTIRDTVARAPREASDYLHSTDFTTQLSIAVALTALFIGFLYSLKKLEDKPELAGWYSDRNNSYIELLKEIQHQLTNENNVISAKITNKTTNNNKTIDIREKSPLQIMRLIIDDETIRWTNNWEVKFCHQNRNIIFQYNNLERRVTAPEEDLESQVSSESKNRDSRQDSGFRNSRRALSIDLSENPSFNRQTLLNAFTDEDQKTSEASNRKIEHSPSFDRSENLSPPLSYSPQGNSPTIFDASTPSSHEEHSLNEQLDYETLQNSYNNEVTEFRATTAKDHYTDTGTQFVTKFNVKDNRKNTAETFSTWIQDIFNNQAQNHVTHIQLMGPLQMSKSAPKNNVTPELQQQLARRKKLISSETKAEEGHIRQESMRLNMCEHLGTVELFAPTRRQTLNF